MRLTSGELVKWVDSFYHDMKMEWTWNKFCQDANMKAITLSVQRRRNQVDASVIVLAARQYGANPVVELAKIPRWSEIFYAAHGLTKKEMLSGLHPGEICGELSQRLLDKNAERKSINLYSRALSVWLDMVGPPSARDMLGKEIGVNASSVSGRLNKTAKFPIDEIIDGFGLLGMSVPYGLLLAGEITHEEAGISAEDMRDALISADSEDLMEVLAVQERYIRRDLKEKEITDEHLRRLG